MVHLLPKRLDTRQIGLLASIDAALSVEKKILDTFDTWSDPSKCLELSSPKFRRSSLLLARRNPLSV